MIFASENIDLKKGGGLDVYLKWYNSSIIAFIWGVLKLEKRNILKKRLEKSLFLFYFDEWNYN